MNFVLELLLSLFHSLLIPIYTISNNAVKVQFIEPFLRTLGSATNTKP
jgi:hypothetical protein